MKDHHSENELALLNRLLEMLHQTDYKVLGSIEINIYKPGSQHVDTIQTQYITTPSPTPSPVGEGEVGKPTEEGELREGEGGDGDLLPEVLRSEEAMALWEKMQAAGYIDEDFQPTVSRTLSAIIADEMARRLGIKEKWKIFEALWHRRNMYRDYYKALDLQQTLTFRDKIRRIIR